MAIIYVSYRHDAKYIVESLVLLLEAKGHSIRFDRDLPIGAIWRDQLTTALLSSDAVLLIWSESTAKSQYVLTEIGAARATPKLAVLPIIIGNIQPPPFIQDLVCEWVYDPISDEVLRDLSEKIDVSIKKHIKYRRLGKIGMPKVFISHRHKDEETVRALVDCIETYFLIDRQDIRCTSVRPYRLPVGETSADRLRNEITDAEVVLGILTRDTLESSYVAFELGSAWGQHVWTCPLLAHGADLSNIPDPIRGLSALFLSKEGDCLQLLNDMEGFTSLVKRKDINNEELSDKVCKLVATASDTPTLATTTEPMSKV
jgi:hypothetical protein